MDASYWTGKMETLLEMNVRALVDQPDRVTVTAGPGEGDSVALVVKVDADDLGKVIGKQGRTARSLRTIMLAAGQRHGTRYTVDFQ